jgi:cell division protein FtsQ
MLASLPLADELMQRRVGSVRVAGEFQRMSRETLESVVRAELDGGGFFAVDVERVRRAARSLPWVREATVRRVWPDSIHIAVTERVPVARWNDSELIEDDGTLFRPAEGVERHALAGLHGPRGSELRVLEQFKRLATGLGTLAGGVRGVSLSDRGQWEVTFGNGMTLVPPSPLNLAVLKATAAALPRILGPRLERAARVDLRYANGFAVRWRDDQTKPGGDEG